MRILTSCHNILLFVMAKNLSSYFSTRHIVGFSTPYRECPYAVSFFDVIRTSREKSDGIGLFRRKFNLCDTVATIHDAWQRSDREVIFLAYYRDYDPYNQIITLRCLVCYLFVSRSSPIRRWSLREEMPVPHT